MIKPFNGPELRQRLKAGERVLLLEKELKKKISELQEALRNVRTLEGILPICAWCKKIRTDDKYWQSVEEYVTEHSRADFTHSICPECRDKFMADADREKIGP